MPITAIVSFDASVPTDVTIEKLAQALKSSHTTIDFVIGVQVQNSSTIQVTSEWPSFLASDALAKSSAFHSFVETIRSISSSSLTTILARLDGERLENSAPPFVEFVKIDFPATEVTPTQQSCIENDFARFETLFRKRGPPRKMGELGLVTGWTDEQNSVRSFVVARGWATMSAFDEAVQSGEFKEGIPILMGWGAEFTLWHVERKVGYCGA